MKKRLLSVILAALMTVGMIVSAIPAVSAAGTMSFKDVKSGDWFYDYVKFVWERDLMKGTSNTTFGPDESMTRGQIVTILSRMSGDNVTGMSKEMNFKDVNKSEYYADPIGWAVKNGIAKGMTATTFEPETPVLRQEFAAFFVRYMNYKGITLPDAGSVTPFPDKAKFPDWATDNIETLQKTGLVKGDAQGNYNPASKMTRAEIATVTMRFTEAVEAQQGDKSLEQIVTEYLDENLCLAHGKLDFTFNYQSSFTEENLKALLKSEMGLGDDVTVTFNFDFVTDLKEDGYAGMGDTGAGNALASNQNFYWPTERSVTFSNTEGDSYTANINFSFHKVLCTGDIDGGKYAAGVRSLCPEDWDDTFHDAEDALADFKGTEDAPFEFSGVLTEATLEAAAREATGLSDAKKYPFFVTGFDLANIEEGIDIFFGFLNKNDVPDNILDLICVETYIKGTRQSLKDAVDEYLDANLCIAHDKLDYTFNYSSSLTEDALGALLKKEMKLADTVEVEFLCDFDFEFKDEGGPGGYSGRGDGGYGSAPAGNAYCWIDDIEVSFTDTATGEEYVVEIDFSIRKVLCSGELGYPGGVKSPCHEDWDMNFHSLELKFAPLKSDEEGGVLFCDFELTPEGLEAKARELTDLTGAKNEKDYPFFLVGYDASKAYSGMGITFGFINKSDSVPSGDYLELIYVSTYIAQSADIQAIFDEFLETYDCWVHSNVIHTTHSTSGMLNEKYLSDLFISVMGLDSSVYSVEFDGFEGDPGLGGGQFTQSPRFLMWVKNNVTGEETEKVSRSLWSRKCLYSGVLAMYCCPDLSEFWVDAEDKLDEVACIDCLDEIEEDLIHVLTPSLDAFNEESIEQMLLAYLDGADGVIINPIDGSDNVWVYVYADTETEVIELTRGFILNPVVDPSVEGLTMTDEHH